MSIGFRRFISAVFGCAHFSMIREIRCVLPWVHLFSCPDEWKSFANAKWLWRPQSQVSYFLASLCLNFDASTFHVLSVVFVREGGTVLIPSRHRQICVLVLPYSKRKCRDTCFSGHNRFSALVFVVFGSGLSGLMLKFLSSSSLLLTFCPNLVSFFTTLYLYFPHILS